MAHPFRYAQAQHDKPSRDWSGWCLVFVRSAFGVPAQQPDAASAWANAERKHPVTSGVQVPRGVPVFWTGGSHGDGHVALSRGGGSVWTTDFVREGKVDVARIDDITRGWGLKLAGWTEDINGVTVYTPPKPAPEPKPSEPRRKQPRAHRRQVLRHRRRRGQTRPAPLLVRVANCASVSTGAAKSTDTFRRALTTPGKHGLPDVVLCQEMSDVDAKAVAHEVGGWEVDQYRPVGSPDSALAIAYRSDRVHRLSSKMKAGTAATSEGGGIRKRPVLIDGLIIDRGTPKAWRSRFASGHAAPSRAPKDRARFLAVFKTLGVRVKGGDMNVPGKVAAALFGRRVFSIGVLHLVVSRWIPASGPTPVDHGSDHKGVDVLLWP
jgi:hypothetical protein